MSVVNRDGRIIFVDPNNIYGNVNGIQKTPDYTDYTISFNLIIDRVKRKSFSESENDTITLGWQGKLNSLSTLKGGLDDGSHNYLTTYYTDIHFNDISEGNIVEGLGVTNVSIVFDSYYVPTVTIKFVDVMGSGLFGREEVVHNKADFTSETLFGAFFTMPYPKFKLHVKGFYGDAVTYQLTCSGFNGEFNSRTGNFEATATFIGYTYALLTDIPFNYIIAAPYCDYYGKEYWNSRVESSDWVLSSDNNGGKMLPLFEIFKEIKQSEIQSDISAADVIKPEEQDKLTRLNEESSMLNGLHEEYKIFIASALKDCETLVSNPNQINRLKNDGEIIYLLRSDGINSTNYPSELKLSKETDNYWNNFKAKADTAKQKYGINIDTEKISYSYNHNEANDKFKNLFNANKEKLDSEYALLYDGIKKDYISKGNTNFYVTISYIGSLNFYEVINERSASIQSQVDVIKQSVHQSKHIRRLASVSIKPRLGDIVKIIMAHLETFIYMMTKCYENILADENNRSVKNLGVGTYPTDKWDSVAETRLVEPWTVFFDTKDGSGSETSVESVKWVGDINDKFEEEKFIRSLYEASKFQIEEAEKITQEAVSSSDLSEYKLSLNVTGLDVIIGNLFSYIEKENLLDLSYLSGLLGFRAFNLISIFDSEINPEIYGRLDGYNYIDKVGESEKITEIFKDKDIITLRNIIKGIMLCKPEEDRYGINDNNKTYHKFEDGRPTFYNKKRQPIYHKKSDDSENLYYNRYSRIINKGNTKNKVLVPNILTDYNTINSKFTYDENKGYLLDTTSIGTNDSKIDGIVTNYLGSDIFGDNVNSFRDKVISPSFYHILTNEDDVKRFDLSKLMLKTDSLISEVEYKSSLSNPILNKWHKDDQLLSRFYNQSKSFKIGKYTDFLIPFSSGNSMTEITKKTINKKGKDYLIKIFILDNVSRISDKELLEELHKSSAKVNNENKWFYNEKEIDINNLFISDLTIGYKIVNKHNSYTTTSYGGPVSTSTEKFEFKEINLFVSDIFHKQKDDDKILERYRKAYLLLFSLGEFIDPNFNFKINFTGIEKLPKFFVLIIGSILYKKLYERKNQGKSFLKKSNDIITNDLYDKLDEKLSVDLFSPIRNLYINHFKEFCEDSKLQEVLNKFDSIKLSNFTIFSFSDDEADDERLVNTINILNILSSNINAKDKKYDIETLVDVPYLPDKSIKLRHNPYLFNPEDKNVQDLLKDLLFTNYIVISNSNLKETETIPETKLDKYLDGFLYVLERKVKKDSFNLNIIDNQTPVGKIDENTRDVFNSMYVYIKNIWDKWLCSAEKDEYNVEKFFNKNFIFIDSFYRNIYDKFYINYKTFIKSYEDRYNNGGFVFNVLGDLASDNNMLFLSLPDYIDMSGDDEENKRTLANIFRPIPYSKMRDVKTMNSFVFIYTGKPSEVSSNGYKKVDSYDIWDSNEGRISDVASKLFSSTPATDDDGYTKYGYNVPSFGISFSKQNNHLFKDIKLTMSNPVQTEQSINTIMEVAKMGSENKNKVMFYGQDIYPIYSNYSYTCEVEMMGCVQIQPLMYFQLMNIPMWRGTYMIFNVEHNISNGNMVTRFRGMKMSSKTLPFVDNFMVNNSQYENGSSINHNISPNSISGVSIMYNTSVEYPKVDENNIPDAFSNVTKGFSDKDLAGVNENIKKLFNILHEKIKRLQEKDGGKYTWNIKITSLRRYKNPNSQHYYGDAMDLVVNVNDKSKLLIVNDIIVKEHLSMINQLIFEYKSGIGGEINCLHVGIKNPSKSQNGEFVFISPDPNGSSKELRYKDVSDKMPKNYIATAVWYAKNFGKAAFVKRFTNFIHKDTYEYLMSKYGDIVTSGGVTVGSENKSESVSGKPKHVHKWTYEDMVYPSDKITNTKQRYGV